MRNVQPSCCCCCCRRERDALSGGRGANQRFGRDVITARKSHNTLGFRQLSRIPNQLPRIRRASARRRPSSPIPQAPLGREVVCVRDHRMRSLSAPNPLPLQQYLSHRPRVDEGSGAGGARTGTGTARPGEMMALGGEGRRGRLIQKQLDRRRLPLRARARARAQALQTFLFSPAPAISPQLHRGGESQRFVLGRERVIGASGMPFRDRRPGAGSAHREGHERLATARATR